MAPLLLAGAVLVAGAFLALVLHGNQARAAAAIVSQAVAAAITSWALAPVFAGGAAITGAWSLSFPLDVVNTRVDALSAFFLAWSLPMTLLGTVYAAGYLRSYFESGRNGGPHFALLNIVALSFLIIYAAQNALIFLLGWELAAVAAWLLVIWEYRNQKVRFAAFNYLVSTHIGLLALVAAFMYLHGQTNSMDFLAFGRYLTIPSGGRSIVFVLLGVSFALKSAFFPVHSWLPRAHSAAPAHVSALMSGVIHKAGLFAFLRFTLLLGQPEEWMGWTVLTFGAVSALFGVLYTASQRDLKRLLGYSSTENVGIAAMGFGIGYLGLSWHDPALVALGIVGGLLHIFNHALFKCLLFYAAGSVYRSTHTVDIERLGGLLRRLPITGVLFLIGALAIAGLPPMNGFVSEFVIYAGLLRGTAPSPAANAALVCAAALLGFVGAVSALAMVRAFGITFLGNPRDPSVTVHDDAPIAMVVPMVFHAAGILLIGVVPAAGLALVGPVVALFGSAGHGLGTVTTVVEPIQWACRGLVLLLGVATAVGWAMGRNSRRHVTWGCGYTAANSRMQYTGSSFSQQLVHTFATFLPQQWRVRLSGKIFPTADGHFEVHVADAVERRIFEVLGRGEQFFVRTAAAVPEEPRFAFAAGLTVLLVMVGLLVSAGGA
jgi:hydrogenase-4 component B